MTMQPGAADGIHHHKDHLLYVLGGDEVTIYESGNPRLMPPAMHPEPSQQPLPIGATHGIPTRTTTLI